MESFQNVSDDIKSSMLFYLDEIEVARMSLTNEYFRSRAWAFLPAIDLEALLRRASVLSYARRPSQKEHVLSREVLDGILRAFKLLPEGNPEPRLRSVFVNANDPARKFLEPFLQLVGKRLFSFSLGNGAGSSDRLLPHLDSRIIRHLDIRVSSQSDSKCLDQFLQGCYELQELSVSSQVVSLVPSILLAISKAPLPKIKRIQLNFRLMFGTSGPRSAFGADFEKLKVALHPHRDRLVSVDICFPNEVNHLFATAMWEYLGFDPNSFEERIGIQAHIIRIDSECLLDYFLRMPVADSDQWLDTVINLYRACFVVADNVDSDMEYAMCYSLISISQASVQLRPSELQRARSWITAELLRIRQSSKGLCYGFNAFASGVAKLTCEVAEKIPESTEVRNLLKELMPLSPTLTSYIQSWHANLAATLSDFASN